MPLAAPAPPIAAGLDVEPFPEDGAAAPHVKEREPPRGFTAADVPALLDRLGGVDPARVRLDPAPGTATAEDAAALGARTGRRYELVDNTLVEKAVSDWTGYFGLRVGALVMAYVLEHKLGVCHGADGFFHFGPDLRGPDCSFTPKSRRRGPLLRQGYSDVPPALVVEVISPRNTRAEMARKRRTYFSHGVDLVWEFYEDEVLVLTGPGAPTRRRYEGTLSGDPVLPGFSLDLAACAADPLAEEDEAGEPDAD